MKRSNPVRKRINPFGLIRWMMDVVKELRSIIRKEGGGDSIQSEMLDWYLYSVRRLNNIWCIYVRVSKTPKNRGLIFTESEVRALYASWILWDPFYLCCIRSWLIQVSMIELLRLRYQINSKVMSVEWYNNSYNSRKFALNCSFH